MKALIIVSIILSCFLVDTSFADGRWKSTPWAVLYWPNIRNCLVDPLPGLFDYEEPFAGHYLAKMRAVNYMFLEMSIGYPNDLCEYYANAAAMAAGYYKLHGRRNWRKDEFELKCQLAAEQYLERKRWISDSLYKCLSLEIGIARSDPEYSNLDWQ